MLQKRAIRAVSRSGFDAHTRSKMNSIHLLKLGQFMYSFSTGNLPPKLDSLSLIITVFRVITQGTLLCLGYLVAGQT